MRLVPQEYSKWLMDRFTEEGEMIEDLAGEYVKYVSHVADLNREIKEAKAESYAANEKVEKISESNTFYDNVVRYPVNF